VPRPTQHMRQGAFPSAANRAFAQQALLYSAADTGCAAVETQMVEMRRLVVRGQHAIDDATGSGMHFVQKLRLRSEAVPVARDADAPSANQREASDIERIGGRMPAALPFGAAVNIAACAAAEVIQALRRFIEMARGRRKHDVAFPHRGTPRPCDMRAQTARRPAIRFAKMRTALRKPQPGCGALSASGTKRNCASTSVDRHCGASSPCRASLKRVRAFSGRRCAAAPTVSSDRARVSRCRAHASQARRAPRRAAMRPAPVRP
jgi:hypothetical protein